MYLVARATNIFNFGLATLLFALLVPAVSTAQAPQKLRNLSLEPSRADLFALIVKDRIAELQQQQPDASGGAFIPESFVFPRDAGFDYKLNIPRENVYFGLDISHYTGVIDFKTLSGQGISFVYAKATQGTGFKDGKFGIHWKKMAGSTKRGAYHFLSAGIDGEAQAKVFINFVNSHGGFTSDDMPPVVDLEWDITRPNAPDAWRNFDADYIIKQTVAWLRYVQQMTGRSPVIYTSRSWWRERGIPENRFEELKPYRLWIADYSRSGKASENPKTPTDGAWHLWQFTDRAKLTTGYARGLDANIFKGTEAEFKEFASR